MLYSVKGKQELIYLLLARHYTKYFVCTSSFNPRLNSTISTFILQRNCDSEKANNLPKITQPPRKPWATCGASIWSLCNTVVQCKILFGLKRSEELGRFPYLKVWKSPTVANPILILMTSPRQTQTWLVQRQGLCCCSQKALLVSQLLKGTPIYSPVSPPALLGTEFRVRRGVGPGSCLHSAADLKAWQWAHGSLRFLVFRVGPEQLQKQAQMCHVSVQGSMSWSWITVLGPEPLRRWEGQSPELRIKRLLQNPSSDTTTFVPEPPTRLLWVLLLEIKMSP